MHTELLCSVTEVNTRATLTPETHIYNYFPSWHHCTPKQANCVLASLILRVRNKQMYGHFFCTVSAINASSTAVGRRIHVLIDFVPQLDAMLFLSASKQQCRVLGTLKASKKDQRLQMRPCCDAYYRSLDCICKWWWDNIFMCPRKIWTALCMCQIKKLKVRS